MLRIVLCDDEPAWCSLLADMVADWAEQRRIEVKTDLCGNADQFFFIWEDEKNMDILLLDIDMPGMDGMRLAHRLRDMGESMQIIFVTGFPEHAQEGYEVDALSYLLKPVKKEQLFACLDKAESRLGRREPELVEQTAEGIVKIRLRDLYFLESMAHDVMLYCRNRPDPIRCRTGIRHMEQKLREKSSSFFRLHRSYLINLACVERIGRREVALEDGTRLPVPRGRWKELNEAYLDYYRGRRNV